jgi:hypothetical protein
MRTLCCVCFPSHGTCLIRFWSVFHWWQQYELVQMFEYELDICHQLPVPLCHFVQFFTLLIVFEMLTEDSLISDALTMRNYVGLHCGWGFIIHIPQEDSMLTSLRWLRLRWQGLVKTPGFVTSSRWCSLLFYIKYQWSIYMEHTNCLFSPPAFSLSGLDVHCELFVAIWCPLF